MSGPDRFSVVSILKLALAKAIHCGLYELVNEALAALVSDFSALYSPIGRPSIMAAAA
jgi:hypothetical protein